MNYKSNNFPPAFDKQWTTVSWIGIYDILRGWTFKCIFPSFLNIGGFFLVDLFFVTMNVNC